MTDTPNLGLPYIDGSQAQKHVTHNEALRILDAAIQIGVLDLTLTAPPSSPAEGERHVVASGATGAWAGQDNAIATWQDGAWAFLAPKTGWCIWSAADSSLFVFDGAAWQSAGGTAALDNVAHLGVNTAASSPNLLSVKSNAALFAAIDAADGGTGDMRLQVSKESSAKTASMFFSDNFSGRAEFGLVGTDAFKLKVSPDGSTWTEAFTIDQDTGNLMLPRGLALTGVVQASEIQPDQFHSNKRHQHQPDRRRLGCMGNGCFRYRILNRRLGVDCEHQHHIGDAGITCRRRVCQHRRECSQYGFTDRDGSAKSGLDNDGLSGGLFGFHDEHAKSLWLYRCATGEVR